MDQLFPWAGSIAGDYTAALYNSGETGAFQANYFRENLASRGLIDSKFGPDFKNFPYFEDASIVNNHISTFISKFVKSYYPTNDLLIKDKELQAWVAEAVPAKVIDFPSAIKDRKTLIDVLTHVAYLCGVEHSVLNTNVPVASSATLPFHPLAFYKPLPTEKGVTDLVPYLPPLEPAVKQIGLLAAFNRPKIARSNLTLAHMFDDAALLDGANQKTKNAAKDFLRDMQDFSKTVSARKFDRHGLSQGMPFIWNALDPEIASFYLTV